MEKNISNLKQRMLDYIAFKGLSKRQFYIETGIANGVLDKTTGLSEVNIERFISTYKEVSSRWLLTGMGSMILDDTEERIECSEIDVEWNEKMKDDKWRLKFEAEAAKWALQQATLYNNQK